MTRFVALVAVFLASIAAAPPAYHVVVVSNGGTISGQITYAGTPPARKEINPTVDAAICGKHGPIASDDLVVSARGGIQYAVVRLTNITEGRAATDLPVVSLVQQGCMFEPHVIAVSAGFPVYERNLDGVLHNVHTHSARNRPVNFAHIPSVPQMLLAKFSAPESIRVTCDVHNWMSAWIWVVSNPYIAITGPDGGYSIAGIPPGHYKVEIWHDTLGSVTREVTVEAGKTTRLDQTYPLPHRGASTKK
ncbi:MAG: carboxypeptidase regulatory-like domain-containing protein [Hyphomicrobiales bacterium]